MSEHINEFAEKWLQELETTDREQGKDYLCREGAFCCLGVAYDMVDNPVGNSESPFNLPDGVIAYLDGPAEEYQVLGTTMRDRLGLKSYAGLFEGKPTLPEGCVYMGSRESIACLNDSGKLSFKEIAAIIRLNADKLFKKVDKQEKVT